MLNTVSHSHFDFLPQSFELQDSNYALIKKPYFINICHLVLSESTRLGEVNYYKSKYS